MTSHFSILPYSKDELNNNTELVTKGGITQIKRTEAKKSRIISRMMMGFYGRKLIELQDLPF